MCVEDTDLGGTQNGKMDKTQFVEKVVKVIAENNRVTTVFGNPITVGDKQVIPVAKVRLSGGLGGGTGDPVKGPSQSTGGGGGGYATTRPLGVFEIDKEKTVFRPALDINFLAILLAVVTFGFVRLLVKSKKRLY